MNKTPMIKPDCNILSDKIIQYSAQVLANVITFNGGARTIV